MIEPDELTEQVRALRNALPGINAWFPTEELERAAYAVSVVVLADLRASVEALRAEPTAFPDGVEGEDHRQRTVALDDVLAVIDGTTE